MTLKQDVMNRQLPATSWATGSVTVTATPASLVAADFRRLSMKLTNKGSAEVFLGESSDVADGMLGESVEPGGYVILGLSAEVFARTVSGSSLMVVTSMRLV